MAHGYHSTVTNRNIHPPAHTRHCVTIKTRMAALRPFIGVSCEHYKVFNRGSLDMNMNDTELIIDATAL